MSTISGPQTAHNVRTVEEYKDKAIACLFGLGKSPILREADVQPAANVSQGRWVIDCVFISPDGEQCRNCPSASPEWNIAICFECGSVYHPIFPDEIERVEHVLSKRPPLNRNFYPHVINAVTHGVMLIDDTGTQLRGETVDDLERENAQFKEITIQQRIAEYERKLRGE